MIDEKKRKEVTSDMKMVVEASLETFFEIEDDILSDYRRFDETPKYTDIEVEVFKSVLHKYKALVEKEEAKRELKGVITDSVQQLQHGLEGEEIVDIGDTEELINAPDCIGQYEEDSDDCIGCEHRERCKELQSVVGDMNMDFFNSNDGE